MDQKKYEEGIEAAEEIVEVGCHLAARLCSFFQPVFKNIGKALEEKVEPPAEKEEEPKDLDEIEKELEAIANKPPKDMFPAEEAECQPSSSAS